jgi:hypothetical protein
MQEILVSHLCFAFFGELCFGFAYKWRLELTFLSLSLSLSRSLALYRGAGLILLVEIVIRQGIGRGLSVLITLLVLMDAMAILIKELKQGFDVAIFFMILLALALAFSGLLCFGRSLWLTEDAKYKTAVLTVVAASNEKPLEVVEEMKGGALEEPTSQAPLDEARREPEGNSNRRPRRAHPRNAFDGITQHYSKRLAFELLLAGASAAKLVTLMQFAFTYSGDIITHTKEEFGMGPQDTMNLIWLMLFSFAGIWNLAYATFLLTRRGTWSQVFSCASPEEEVDAHSGPACCRTAGMLRPWLQSGVCALLFIAFPRCFGAASLEFGDSGEVASISLLMVMILYFGQLWSIFLGEWEGETRRPIILNALALVLVCLSVVVLICGGAFLF